MKLCVVNINPESVSGSYTELLTKNFNRVKREDTVVGWKYVKHLKRATDTILSYAIHLNKTEIIECFYEAAQEGYDGAMVACSGDPGVSEAQDILDIPVVGPMEAACHVACMYGHKFGIVTVLERRWSEYCEHLTVRHGLHSRLSGIERISIPSKEAFTKGFLDPEWVGKEIREKSRKLVENGANSVVIGSAGMSTMASVINLSTVAEYDAPIFDCLSVGLKMLELRVDLQKRLGIPPVSRTGTHELIQKEDVIRLRTLFGLEKGTTKH